MREPESERAVIASFADQIAKRTCRRTIRYFQGMKSGLANEDSGLETQWDEICVQVQDDAWTLWHVYDDTIRDFVAGLISDLLKHERAALWLQTTEGWEWLASEVEDRETDPEFEGTIVQYLLSEHIYREAGRWSNEQIRRYLDRAAMTD